MKDLYNKPVNELTVKDSLKIQAQLTAAFVVVGGLLIGASVVAERVHSWRKAKKAFKNKLEN